MGEPSSGIAEGRLAPADGPAGPGRALPRRGVVDRRHAGRHGGRRASSRCGGDRLHGALEGPAVAGHLRRRRPRRPAPGRRRCAPGASGPGDVVVFQLPNWVEAGVTFWAAAYLGAVVVPIVHFYGAKEVSYILDAMAPDVVVTADRFGHTDYLATYEPLLADQPGAALARGRRHAGGRAARRGRRRSTSLLDGEPVDRAGGGRPGRAGDRRASRRARPATPRASSTRTARIGFEIRQLERHVPDGRPAADHRLAGRPLHRDAQRLPGPAAAGAAGQPDRRVGPGRGPAADARGGARRHRAAPPSS